MTDSVFFDELGPKGRKRAAIWTVISGILMLAGIVWCGVTLYAAGQLSSDLWRVWLNPDLLSLLAFGLASTFKAAIVALGLSLFFGMLLAAPRMSQSAAVRLGFGFVMEVIRGFPLLLLIFFIYLGGPTLGVDVTTFWALVGGITLYNSVAIGEIIRAGVLSLPSGQTEAALAIGLRSHQAMLLVRLPQAVRRMLPALISQAVVLLKETSLGFIVGYTELLREGRIAVEYLGGQYSIPVYAGIAAIYVTICVILSSLARWLERRPSHSGEPCDVVGAVVKGV